MGISVVLLLTAAMPATASAPVVTGSLAADPVSAHVPLERPVIAFSASTRPLDLRYLSSEHAADEEASFDLPRLAPLDKSSSLGSDPRLDQLVIDDPGAAMTGRRVRRSRMAAGLSLRVVQSDGVLLPTVGMSGAAGRALTRMALEAVAPE